MSSSMEFRTKLTLMVYNKDRSNHLRAIRETVLPFIPSDGMHLQVGMAYPITITKVVWLTDEQMFHCTAEEMMYEYEFNLESDVDELIDMLNILANAKLNGWIGFDKIYRDK